MSLSTVNALLAQALPGAGLPAVSLNTSGMAEITVRGLAVALEYREAEQRLVLYCSLGRLPADASSGLCEFLLETSLFGARLGGGHLGLYPPTRTLLFSVSLAEADLTPARLGNALQRFAEQAASLIADVEQHLTEQRETSDMASFAGTMLWV